MIYVIKAFLDTYKENNEELWIIFQDIKRAFDSCGYDSLTMAFKRIKLPKKYIEYQKNCNTSRELKY